MSPPPPNRPVTPTTTSAAERRYTEEDLALILNRAAELQDGAAPSTPRYTLAEIQEIAAGAGIAPNHVASVAASLGIERAQRDDAAQASRWRFHFDESIEGEISDDTVAELFEIARRELGLHGSISEALGAIEWKATDQFGSSFVTIARRGGRTTISVLLARTDAAALTGILGGTGAVLGSVILGAVLAGAVGVAAPIAAVAGIGVAGGGAWLSMRSVWRRHSRRFAERTERLGAMLVAAARGAVEDGRVAAR